MTEYMNTLKLLHGLMEVTETPVLTRIFDVLLDEEKLILSPKCYEAVNKSSRIFSRHLEDYGNAVLKLEKWVGLLQLERHGRRLSAKDMSREGGVGNIHHKSNPDNVHAVRLLEEWATAFDIAAALMKPRMVICESYLEKRFPMKQLEARPELLVMRYFCRRYTKAFPTILKQVQRDYSNDADDAFIVQMVVTEGQAVELEEPAVSSVRRHSNSSVLSGMKHMLARKLLAELSVKVQEELASTGAIPEGLEAKLKDADKASADPSAAAASLSRVDLVTYSKSLARRSSVDSTSSSSAGTVGASTSNAHMRDKIVEKNTDVGTDGEWSNDEDTGSPGSSDDKTLADEGADEAETEWIDDSDADDSDGWEGVGDSTSLARVEKDEGPFMKDPILRGLLAGAGAVAMRPDKRGSAVDVLKAVKIKKDQRRRLKAWILKKKKLLKKYLIDRTRTHLLANDLLDQYLVTATALVTCLAFSELLKNKVEFAEFMTAVSQLSSDFIRTCLPMLSELLSFSPNVVRNNIMNLSLKNLRRSHSNQIMCEIIYKVRLLNGILVSLDNHIFPRTFSAHAAGIKCIALSNMVSHVILTGGYDRVLRIWDTDSAECLALFIGHKSIITSCKFSSKDHFIVSSSFDSTVKIWNAQTAQCKLTLSGHTDSVTSADISPDDSLIVSSSLDSTVRLWNTRDGLCLRIFRGHAPPAWVKSVVFSPDGKFVLSGGLDRRVASWAIRPLPIDASKQRPVESWVAHDDYILDMAVAAPGTLVTTSKDRSIRFWNLETGALRKILATSLPTWCCSVRLSRDAKLTLAHSYDNFVLIFHSASGKLLRQLRVQNAGIQSSSFNSDATAVILGTSDGKLQIVPL